MDVAIAEREEVVAVDRKAQGEEEKAATEADALMLLLACRPTRLLKM